MATRWWPARRGAARCDLRERALGGALPATASQPAALAAALAARVDARLAPRLRRVLNLTGTVIHTNLGARCWPSRPCSTCWP